MGVQIWGVRPEHPAEREVLSYLYKKLKPLDEPYYLLTNFELPPGIQLDLLVIKHDGLFIVEVKYCPRGKIVGTINGDWKVFDRRGRVMAILNEGLPVNPYQQVVQQYHALQHLLEERKADFLAPEKVGMEFTDIKKVLAFVPAIPIGSELEVGDRLKPPRGAVLGLEELPEYIYNNRSWGLFLGDQEIARLIKEVLHLPPQVIKLRAPCPGAVWSGTEEIRWDLLIPYVEIAWVEIFASRDGGRRWRRLAVEGKGSGRYRWDTTRMPNGTDYLVKVVAKDGEGRVVGEDRSELFQIRNEMEVSAVAAAEVKSEAKRRLWRWFLSALLPMVLSFSLFTLLWWHPWRPQVQLQLFSPQELELNLDRYLGQVVRVRFRVVETEESAEVIYLNSTSDRYETDFTAVIFKEDLSHFERRGIDPLADYYRKLVEVVGKVRSFKGPEIILKTPAQIRIFHYP